MGDITELTTWPKPLNAFYKITSNAIAFEIKASGNAAVGLSRRPANNCDYWITLGDGQQCLIKKMGNRNYEAVRTPGILHGEEYRKFWLTWSYNLIRLGRDGCPDHIVSCDNDIEDLNYITFTMVQRRNPVHWRFVLPPNSEKVNFKPVTSGKLQWVPYENDQAFTEQPLMGGFEQEQLYIARAKHRGSLTPGCFVPSLAKAYIPWGGEANEKTEFEVLCGFDGIWVTTSADEIPVGALVGGYSEDSLERLYIGRALCEGNLIPGKVQPSHSACYITYKGKEVPVNNYEILVLQKEHEKISNNTFVTERVALGQGANDDLDAYSEYSNYTDEENENAEPMPLNQI